MITHVRSFWALREGTLAITGEVLHPPSADRAYPACESKVRRRELQEAIEALAELLSRELGVPSGPI